LSTSETLQKLRVEVILLKLEPRDITQDLVSLRRRKVKTFIVDVGAALIPQFLSRALAAGLMGEGDVFLFTDLEFASVDWSQFAATGAALLGLDVIDRRAVVAAVNDKRLQPELAELMLKSAHASLLHDGLQLFSAAVERASAAADLAPPAVSCQDREDVYASGARIAEALEQVREEVIHLRVRLRVRRATVLDARVRVLRGERAHLRPRGGGHLWAEGEFFMAPSRLSPPGWRRRRRRRRSPRRP